MRSSTMNYFASHSARLNAFVCVAIKKKTRFFRTVRILSKSKMKQKKIAVDVLFLLPRKVNNELTSPNSLAG